MPMPEWLCLILTIRVFYAIVLKIITVLNFILWIITGSKRSIAIDLFDDIETINKKSGYRIMFSFQLAE